MHSNIWNETECTYLGGVQSMSCHFTSIDPFLPSTYIKDLYFEMYPWVYIACVVDIYSWKFNFYYLQEDCHQSPKRGRLKNLDPLLCVNGVLVINDKPICETNTLIDIPII